MRRSHPMLLSVLVLAVLAVPAGVEAASVGEVAVVFAPAVVSEHRRCPAMR